MQSLGHLLHCSQTEDFQAPPRDLPSDISHRKRQRAGPIALVREGDIIEVNIPERILQIVGIAGERKTPEEIDAVLKERKNKWSPKPSKYTKGSIKNLFRKGRFSNEGRIYGVDTMNVFDISGKKAIVTGGTRGLGYKMAEGYLEAGCEVAIVGTSDSVYNTAQEFRDRGFSCHGVKGNLGERREVYRVFQECVELLGGDLDILLTAHGIQRRHSAEEFPVEEWDEVISVNLTSIFILCQEAGRIMLQKGYGKIITIASMNSFFGGQTIPAYEVCKRGNCTAYEGTYQ